MTGSSRGTPSPAAIRLAAFGLALLVLVSRGWGRLTRPELWGEDGQIFLAQALTSGFHSLLQPMAGSYFTLERLIMLGALELAPFAWLPAVVSTTCVVVSAAVASMIASPRYEWLMPSAPVRVLAAAIFCLLPGLSEMLGNLCNLNWILFSWLALTGLKDPALPITKAEITMSLLVSISIGTTILLIPLFAWRLVVLLQQRRPRQEWMPGLLQAGVLVFFGVVLLLLAPGNRPRASMVPSYLDVARAWYDHAARLVALTPWLGDQLTFFLYRWQPAGLYRIAKVAFLVFIAAWGWRHRHEPLARALLLFTVCVSLWTVLAVLTRPYAMETLQNEHGQDLYASRYSFISSFAGLIFWLGVLKPAGRRPGLLLLAFLALNLVLPLHRFTIGAYGDERRWLATATVLEQAVSTGCPRAVRVRQYPDPWEFTYVPAQPGAECR